MMDEIDSNSFKDLKITKEKQILTKSNNLN
jgi:hypothetical protein